MLCILQVPEPKRTLDPNLKNERPMEGKKESGLSARHGGNMAVSLQVP